MAKIIYHKTKKGSEIKYNIIVVSLNIQFSSTYGCRLRPLNEHFGFKKRGCNIHIEEDLKTLILSDKKFEFFQGSMTMNENLAFEILKLKLDNELARRNTERCRKKMVRK